MNAAALARYETGLSLADAARSAEVSEAALRRIENGETTRPSAPVAKRLADLYGISVAQLLGVDVESAKS